MMKRNRILKVKLVLTVVFSLLLSLTIGSFRPANAAKSEDPEEFADTAIRKKPPLVPVLIYHRVLAKTYSIYDFTPEELEKHFSYLKENGYTTITAMQFMDMSQHPELFPEKPVVLTFDDGHKSHYTAVLPLLKKFGFKATFFVYTDVIATISEKQLTWDELAEMRREGMDIESHTKSHPYLTKIRDQETETAYLERLNRELSGSKAILEQKLNCKVDLLAYPYGWFNSTIEKAAVKAGYRGAFTVNWGVNQVPDNPLRIKRRVMEYTMGVEGLKSIVTARPLPIEVLNPQDAGVFYQAPEVKFKLAVSGLSNVEVKVRSFEDKLSPDNEGYYTWSGLKEMKPGYYMVVVRGYDSEKKLHIGSWGFDYELDKVNLGKTVGQR